MLAEKDPLAMRLFEQYRGIRMPNLGLSPGQVSAVVAYMKKSGDGAP
jgi:hypothetical protein